MYIFKNSANSDQNNCGKDLNVFSFFTSEKQTVVEFNSENKQNFTNLTDHYI